MGEVKILVVAAHSAILRGILLHKVNKIFKIDKDRNLHLIDVHVWPAVMPTSTATDRSTVSYSG